MAFRMVLAIQFLAADTDDDDDDDKTMVWAPQRQREKGRRRFFQLRPRTGHSFLGGSGPPTL
jgi:hypothetical protein